MDLTVLGYWAPYPRAGEACSGYLLRSDSTRILVDCGHSVFSILQKYEDFRRLDAVIISHFHPDHYVDLYALRHAVRGAIVEQRRSGPLRLFIPAQPEQIFAYWQGTEEFVVADTTDHVRVGDIDFRFYPAVHSMPGYYIVAEDASGRRLVYTGDTDYVEDKLFLADRANLFLVEASLLERDREYARKAQHLTAKEAGRWAARCGVEKMLVTHLWPEYRLEEIETEVRSEFTGSMWLASEGLTLTV